MNHKKTWALVLKAPALLLLISSFFVGLYAAIYNIEGMGWEIPIILGVVILLYSIGSKMERNYFNELNEFNTLNNELKELNNEK